MAPLQPPKFKSRKSKQTARFVGANYKIGQDKTCLPKVGKIKIVGKRKLPTEPSSLTIIKDSANRYFASFVVEINPESLTKTNKSIGIDLGISTFATLSNGEKINAPKPLKNNLKKLAKFQRKFVKTEKGSKRREKRRLRITKLHGKIKDIRTDFLHKLSTNLVKKYDTIVLEDLFAKHSEGNVSGMVKNRKLAKAISDLGWREFRTLTEAKCEKYGREFRVISRWEPTSQKCSNCGFKGGKKELNVREWTCLNCGTSHDRDINAAVNILEILQPKTKVETKTTENPVQLSLFTEVAEGHWSIIYRTRRKRQTGKPAFFTDVSTRSESFE